MSQKDNFFNINDLSKGISRTLTKGLKASIFPGEKAMVSIVTIEPNSIGNVHVHPEEQWSILISGDAIRIQGGEEIQVKEGDFWFTPGGVSHGVIGGKKGALILDFFAPARDEYRRPGKGYAKQ